jgi:hypothetical protein
VVAKPGFSPEDEHVARLQSTFPDGIAAAEPAEQKLRCIADRERHNWEPGSEGFRTLIFVLVKAHAALRTVPIDDAEIGREGEAGDAGKLAGHI